MNKNKTALIGIFLFVIVTSSFFWYFSVFLPARETPSLNTINDIVAESNPTLYLNDLNATLWQYDEVRLFHQKYNNITITDRIFHSSPADIISINGKEVPKNESNGNVVPYYVRYESIYSELDPSLTTQPRISLTAIIFANSTTEFMIQCTPLNYDPDYLEHDILVSSAVLPYLQTDNCFD